MDKQFSAPAQKQAEENRLLKRALAGDKQAKNQIEARELLLQADRFSSSLRDKAVAGDKAAMGQLRRLAAGAAATAQAPGSPASKHPATSTGYDVQAAAKASGVAQERARWATVFASEHARGRERGLANLLASDQAWSAEAILKELPHLPTDAQGNSSASRATASTGDAWANVYAKVDARKSAPTAGASISNTAPAGNDPHGWGAAYKELSA